MIGNAFWKLSGTNAPARANRWMTIGQLFAIIMDRSYALYG